MTRWEYATTRGRAASGSDRSTGRRRWSAGRADQAGRPQAGPSGAAGRQRALPQGPDPLRRSLRRHIERRHPLRRLRHRLQHQSLQGGQLPKKPTPCGGSRSSASAHGSPAPVLCFAHAQPLWGQAVSLCRAPLDGPTCVGSPVRSPAFLRSSRLLPTQTRTRGFAPRPCARPVPGPLSEYLLGLAMTPSSQEMEPPRIPRRFIFLGHRILESWEQTPLCLTYRPNVHARIETNTSTRNQPESLLSAPLPRFSLSPMLAADWSHCRDTWPHLDFCE
jgi:hypothetical protein